jgi:hypothetical protein
VVSFRAKEVFVSSAYCSQAGRFISQYFMSFESAGGISASKRKIQERPRPRLKIAEVDYDAAGK